MILPSDYGNRECHDASYRAISSSEDTEKYCRTRPRVTPMCVCVCQLNLHIDKKTHFTRNCVINNDRFFVNVDLHTRIKR